MSDTPKTEPKKPDTPKPDAPKKDGLIKHTSIEIIENPNDKLRRFTFTVNGEKSHYYSSQIEGLNRTIKAVMFGVDRSKTVTLKPLVKSGGKVMGKAEPAVDPGSEWAFIPKQEDRIKAFLTRGKLGSSKDTKPVDTKPVDTKPTQA